MTRPLLAVAVAPPVFRPFPWEPTPEYVKMRLRKSYFSRMAKSSAPKRKGKVKWVRYALLSVMGLGIYHILSGPSGAINLLKLRKANAKQARELDSLTVHRSERAIEKVRLEKDSAYIEQVARKELGMAKTGEKVFRFMRSADSRLDENQEKKK